MADVTFADPLVVVLAVLRARAGEGGLLAGMTFGTKDPEPTVDGGPVRPYGRVSVDYTYGTWPVREIANTRLVVWAATDFAAADLAKKCRAALLSAAGTVAMSGIGPLTGPLPARDGDNPICSITVAVRLRPITL